MLRKVKNLIMVIVIIMLSIGMFFTITSSPKKENTRMQPQNMNFSEMQNMVGNGNMGEMGQPPEMPNNENMQKNNPPEKPEGQEMPDRGNQVMMERTDNMSENMKADNTKKYILVGIEGLGIALILVYLILSKFNKLNFKETFGTKNKILIYTISVIVITAGCIGLMMILNKNNPRMENMEMPNEEVEKQTTAEDVQSGKNVTQTNIDLSKYTSNITITNKGEYTITGEFKNSILINADGEVTLNLNNVNINSQTTAAIANISSNPLNINLPESTTNTLSDGGSSEYDGCLYSEGHLTISGNGRLDIYGNQEEGEGIATDTNNITINGGNINIKSNDDGLNAGGDGGTIEINNGTVYIKASGDGIDSNKNIVINGGSVYSMGSAKRWRCWN